jgi:hypothetical protein
MGKPMDVTDRNYKVPVVRRDAYCLSFEHTGSFTFIHCDVFRPWTKTVLKEMAADFDTLKALHVQPIYASHTPGDTKHLKFLLRFGFQFLGPYIAAGSGQPLQLFTTGK